MKNEVTFCLRVDVDTFEGLKKGLPKVKKIAEDLECPATIFLSLGKYETGRNIKYLLEQRREKSLYVIPMWQRTNWRDLLRGVIFPIKRIGQEEKDFLNSINQSKWCEIHPHGYNHVVWAHNFHKFGEEKTQEYLAKAFQEYSKLFNKEPIANAAPNFNYNSNYLKLLKNKNLIFASDTKYSKPFYPLYNLKDAEEQNVSVLQLPVTEVSIEDLMRRGYSNKDVINYYERRFEEIMEKGINYTCLYVHAIFEPYRFENLLRDVLELAKEQCFNLSFQSEFAKKNKNHPEIRIETITR